MDRKSQLPLNTSSNQILKSRYQKDTIMNNNAKEDSAVIIPNDNLQAHQTTLHHALTESEEVKQVLETYEKNKERQNSAVNTPTGILKHNRCSEKENLVKPVSVTRLIDRDIVVIDKTDIKESAMSEGKVIVIDKHKQQKEVDLADLLGGNWPSTAGGAALVLNKAIPNQQSNQKHVFKVECSSCMGSNNSIICSHSQQKVDRNKSPNPLSHFVPLYARSLEKNNQWDRPQTSEEGTTINSNGSTFFNRDCNLVTDNLMGPSKAKDEFVDSSSLSDISQAGLGVGSMVEISIPDFEENLYGVVRWIGVPPESICVFVGVELEDDQDDKRLPITDGSFNSVSLFKCPEGRALFVRPSQCSKDRRFLEADAVYPHKLNSRQQPDTKIFGHVDCPPVPGAVAPLKKFNLEELEEVCGKFKGIQGHHNSCYLDATLFSMFTFTHVFDSLLYRPSTSDDIANYEEVQKVLREEIVNPLRKHFFVRADRVMKLRELLDKLSSVSGLTSEEKDPEEFLNSLLAQIMRVEPFLKLSSGQDAYYYQLFVEKDERLSFPSVQQLFEQSFYSSDIKLKEIPSCLIIQMPRFGKNFKMYPRILPSQVLDVTDIIEDSPRQCSVCGKLAECECRECFGILQGGVGLESTAFCKKCLETVHLHAKRANHKPKEISVPHDFKMMAKLMTVPRLYMELFAVVCIETSHYVAFVKAGSGPDAPWCFFDSMADRKGEKNGYNIPEMIMVPDLPLWLSEEGARTVNETSSNDKMLPEHAKRLFCDAYMCMYQSTDVMMYR